MRVLEIAGDEALESLLSRSVPQLQAVGAVVVHHVLDQEVDADGGVVGVLETVVDETLDYGSLPHVLVTQKHHLVLDLTPHRRRRQTHP